MGSSTVVAKYKYDALGRRVEKHVVTGAVTTRYILDGQDVVEEFDGNNTWLARYFHEDRIDHPRAMDRADISDVDGDGNTSEILRFTYHQNALGSVSEISAPGGGVDEWVTYDVYGKATVRNSAGTTQGSSYVGNPFLFTGREFDAESGMYHYRARAYDPEAGRFLQRDPLGYVDGLGLYEYVRSRPPRFVDPLGREGEDKGAENDKKFEEVKKQIGKKISEMKAGDAALNNAASELAAATEAHWDMLNSSGFDDDAIALIMLAAAAGAARGARAGIQGAICGAVLAATFAVVVSLIYKSKEDMEILERYQEAVRKYREENARAQKEQASEADKMVDEHNNENDDDKELTLRLESNIAEDSGGEVSVGYGHDHPAPPPKDNGPGGVSVK